MNEDKTISEKALSEKNDVESQACIETKAREQPSIISLFFDQLNFKGLLKKIFEKTPIKLTDQLIDAILLFIFLVILLYPLGVLKFQLSSYTAILIAIGLGIILEFVGINTPLLKRFFATDMRTKMILDRIPSMTKREIEDEIKFLNFSSKCMNFFLRSLEREKSKYPSFFIDLVIKTQVFRKENLDLLFSPKLIKYIRPDIMIEVLFKNRDFLTQENIQNIYDCYKTNDNIIKILIATQKDSYFLMQNSLDAGKSEQIVNGNFSKFYKIYQEEEKHLDWKLKIIPLSKFPTIRNSLLFISFFGFLAIYVLSVANGNIALRRPEDSLAIFFASFFLTALFMGIIVDPTMRKIKNFYFKRYIHNIVNI